MRPTSAAFALLGVVTCVACAQDWKPPAPPPAPRHVDSVVVTAGPEYKAGAFHTFWLGKNYRELWATPIKVPVLDLRTYAGGLKPAKKGGGMQTESLRLQGKDGEEYVFRTVNKIPHIPGSHDAPAMAGALARGIFRDQISSEHPAAAMIVAPLLEAAGVIHVTPSLFVMPNDTILGEYTKEFAGRLGMVELYPSKPGKENKENKEAKDGKESKEPNKDAKESKEPKESKEAKENKEAKEGKDGEVAGFAGSLEIIDSDSLRILMDRDPREHIDARAFLTARLMDMFLNDVDRHPGNWKWGRMEKGVDAPWVAIPRDRDQAFVTFHGALLAIVRMGTPIAVPFDGTIRIAGLTFNSLEMDRRLLNGVERPTWDSVATELTTRLTDRVIDSAVRMMPVEYQYTAPWLAATLKQRRDNLKKAANEFYLWAARIVDIHLTDAADRLVVTRAGDGVVDVRTESETGRPYFKRRFLANETREIRLYLHGGNDSARVVGVVQRSIPIKIIGGNGSNWLVDSATVGGEAHQARLFDSGTVEGVTYGKDTLFNRRPFVEQAGKSMPPAQDRGTGFAPDVGISDHRELGLIPHIGVDRYTYAFRDSPYSSMLGADLKYALGLPGYRFEMKGDKRWEGTRFHIEGTAVVSQLEFLGYHGLGNDTPDSASNFFDVRQQQWQFRPSLSYALGDSTDLSIGPLVQYTVTDSTPNRFISSTRPYGFNRFTEAGLQLGFHHDEVDRPRSPHRRIVLDVTGTVYPAMGDVTSVFEKVEAKGGAMFTFPIVTNPVLIVRGGAVKLYGSFPFFEAAQLGGDHTIRRMDPQRYTGDAAVYGISELRVPLLKFALFFPMAAGVIGTTEAGRVYVDGRSPGGWHTASGGGIWAGFANQSFIVSCTVTNEPGHSGPHCQTGLSF